MSSEEIKIAHAQKRGKEFLVEICGPQVPAIKTAGGVRAVAKEKPVEAKGVEKYPESKFGELLGAARAAMRRLAKAFQPEQLSEKKAFSRYERFRPAIPEGVRGWGAKGTLDIDRVRSLAFEK